LSTRTRTAADVWTEKEFQATVLELARLMGWHAQTHWSERHSAAGWPDLTLCRGARLLFLELKTQKGKLSFAQREWLDDLETVAMSNPGV